MDVEALVDLFWQADNPPGVRERKDCQRHTISLLFFCILPTTGFLRAKGELWVCVCVWFVTPVENL